MDETFLCDMYSEVKGHFECILNYVTLHPEDDFHTVRIEIVKYQRKDICSMPSSRSLMGQDSEGRECSWPEKGSQDAGSEQHLSSDSCKCVLVLVPLYRTVGAMLLKSCNHLPVLGSFVLNFGASSTGKTSKCSLPNCLYPGNNVHDYCQESEKFHFVLLYLRRSDISVEL
jgi:hypothetical protein